MYTPQPQVGSVYYSGIVVRGQGFGEPGPNSFIKIKRHVYGAYWRKVDSTAALVWKDDLIVVRHGYQVKGGELRVFTPDGTSAIASITQAYEYTSVPTLLDGGHYPFPLALTVGVGSQVWVNSEFHRDLFQMLTPSGTMTLTPLWIPHDQGCGPFWLSTVTCELDGSHATRVSGRGEDVMVDPFNRVWFTQGGGVPWAGGPSGDPDHSRILRLNPFTYEWRVFDIPGNRNGVNGIAFDPPRNRVWFTSDPHDGIPGKLTSFNPDSALLESQVCALGEPDDDCYREYSIGTSSLVIAHVVVDGVGDVWYTGFWQNGPNSEVGRLNPETGQLDRFPLAPTIQCPCPEPPLYSGDPNEYCCNDEALWVGPGPWSIAVAPDGNIAFNEFYDNTLSRFRVDMLTSPTACRSLVDGKNPCVEELVVPETRMRARQHVHSAAFDSIGNYWFTHGQFLSAAPSVPTFMGYVVHDWSEVVILPPLSTVNFSPKGDVEGIAVDQVTGDVFIAEGNDKRISRLRRTL